MANASLSCGGNALALLTISGRPVLYGTLCNFRVTPTVMCRDTHAHTRFARVFNSSCYWALLDQDGEFYFAAHWFNSDTMHVPRAIFGGSKVSCVAFGIEHVLLLTTDNNLFAGGFEKSCALGPGRQVHGGVFVDMLNHMRSQHSLRVLQKLDHDEITVAGRLLGVVCVQCMSGVWTQHGVWLWGVGAGAFLAQDKHAQYRRAVGRDGETRDSCLHGWPDVREPTRVAHLNILGALKHVAVGRGHAGVVDTTGSVYMWGHNDEGQCVTQNASGGFWPCQVHRTAFDGDDIDTIKVSDKHTTFLTATGQVWTAGRICGRKGGKLMRVPGAFFGDRPVREIDASRGYVAAINDGGAVFTWGMQLGNTDGVLQVPATATGSPTYEPRFYAMEPQRGVRVCTAAAIPMQISSGWFDSELVGHWFRRLAFAMAAHARLGSKSPAAVLLPEMLRNILV